MTFNVPSDQLRPTLKRALAFTHRGDRGCVRLLVAGQRLVAAATDGDRALMRLAGADSSTSPAPFDVYIARSQITILDKWVASLEERKQSNRVHLELAEDGRLLITMPERSETARLWLSALDTTKQKPLDPWEMFSSHAEGALDGAFATTAEQIKALTAGTSTKDALALGTTPDGWLLFSTHPGLEIGILRPSANAPAATFSKQLSVWSALMKGTQK